MGGAEGTKLDMDFMELERVIYRKVNNCCSYIKYLFMIENRCDD